MRCIVTAGPTYEPLDDVRRLTNSSTGRLGAELASFLTARKHEVTLLIGQHATFQGSRDSHQVDVFTTTSDLREKLCSMGGDAVDAVFHAAAVSDFKFGKVWVRSDHGELTEIKSGKISTRQGTLLAELLATPKIIAELRQLFPKARLIGWKFEVEGDRAGVIRAAEKQIAECSTNACVANGPGYGPGFGLVRQNYCTHLQDVRTLYQSLEMLLG